ncbi:hypothetical protein [Anaeromicropila populeti]|uniref:Uncharacterized protein n=1 Tax=Anaeromicropila populeti TaxID=37658 RepID=A0A1I6L0V5_9FIRM|nr:hypothetical protein [Anaeromicropila populeti]SFR97123.1 hypothetical protein SAMN05661086_02971 [Anaeromicropila populeti]
MKVEGNFKFLGTEEFKNKEGKSFTSAGFLQGLDVEKILLNEEHQQIIRGLKPMQDVKCVLKISINQDRTYVNLLEVVPISAK